MSTRCNIIVKNNDEIHQFYQHYDGYPSCTGKEVKEICDDCDFNADETIEELKCNYEYEGSEESIHFDIAWLYVIDITAKTVTGYETGCSEYTVDDIMKSHYSKVEL